MEKIKNIKLPNGEVYELGGSGLDGKITNCITEIPQRIKYTLENGTLTIKAGSVVIVPYGTTDRTSEFPVGARFVNDNFKVYDTQFEDGKFFVWAELQRDISQNNTTTVSMTRYGGLTISNESGQTVLYNQNNLESGTTNVSSKTYTIYYNSKLNRIGYAGDTTTVDTTNRVMPFPIFIGTSNVDTNRLFDKIDEVFNGFGYIGSTVWVDKGVKGLIPNGRNKDGTLKNIEFVSSKVITQTKTDGYSRDNFDVVIGHGGVISFTTTRYEVQEDGYIYNMAGTVKLSMFSLGRYSSNANTITSFQPKQPFRAVDYNDLAEVKNNMLTATMGKSNNGYCKFSNGLIIQWGQTPSFSGTTTVTLPTPFTTANYRPVATPAAGGDYDANWDVRDYTTTSFRINQPSSGSKAIAWHAIGY